MRLVDLTSSRVLCHFNPDAHAVLNTCRPSGWWQDTPAFSSIGLNLQGYSGELLVPPLYRDGLSARSGRGCGNPITGLQGYFQKASFSGNLSPLDETVAMWRCVTAIRNGGNEGCLARG
jgi:hypothetical protein